MATTKLIYPGVVLAGVPFSWSIENSTTGLTWEGKLYKAGVLTATYTGTVGAGGSAFATGSTLSAGTYELQITFSNGEFVRVPVVAQATLTFLWRPSEGAASPRKPKVRVTQFGDGYAQRVANGINNNPEQWDVTFDNLSDLTATQIELFLEMAKGVQSFEWLTPRGQVKKFTCDDWSRTYAGEERNSIRAKFEQAYL